MLMYFYRKLGIIVNLCKGEAEEYRCLVYNNTFGTHILQTHCIMRL